MEEGYCSLSRTSRSSWAPPPCGFCRGQVVAQVSSRVSGGSRRSQSEEECVWSCGAGRAPGRVALGAGSRRGQRAGGGGGRRGGGGAGAPAGAAGCAAAGLPPSEGRCGCAARLWPCLPRLAACPRSSAGREMGLLQTVLPATARLPVRRLQSAVCRAGLALTEVRLSMMQKFSGRATLSLRHEGRSRQHGCSRCRSPTRHRAQAGSQVGLLLRLGARRCGLGPSPQGIKRQISEGLRRPDSHAGVHGARGAALAVPALAAPQRAAPHLCCRLGAGTGKSLLLKKT